MIAIGINNSPPANGKQYELKELQDAVGGYIELVAIPPGVQMALADTCGERHDIDLVMVVNEEGRLKGLPINPLASLIAGHAIVGNVMIIRRDMLR